MNPVGPIASAISEGFKLVAQVLAGREKANMEAAIQSAEEYMFADKGVGKYEKMTQDKRNKLKEHYFIKFFKRN